MSRARIRTLLAATGLTLAVALAFAHGPFWSRIYVAADDYPTLLAAIADPNAAGLVTPLEHTVQDGRPVYGLLLEAAISLAGRVDRLGAWRALGSLGVLALGLLATLVLRGRGASAATAGLLGAGVALLPTAAVWAGWAIMFPFPWAATVSLTAGALAEPALVETWDGSRRARAIRLLSAAGLLVVALGVYQPAAQFFWLAPLARALFDRPVSGRERLRRAAASSGVFLAALLIYLAAWRSIYLFGLESFPPRPRTSVLALAELPAKLEWFMGEVLRNAASLFWLPPSPVVAVGVGCVAAVGLGIRARARNEPGVGLGLELAAILLWSHMANLISTGGWAAYRTVGALAAGLWWCAAAGAFALAESTLGARRGQRVALVATAALLVIQVGQLRWRLAPALVEPLVEEADLAAPWIDLVIERAPRRVVFRSPPVGTRRAELQLYDELGGPASSAPWVPEAMIRIAVLGRAGRPFGGEVEVLEASAPLPAARRDTVTIDLRAEYERLARADLVIFGDGFEDGAAGRWQGSPSAGDSP